MIRRPQATQKPGRIRRLISGARGYARRRALGDAISIGGRSLRSLVDEAGLAGAGAELEQPYADGGRDAFEIRALAAGHDQETLGRLQEQHRCSAIFYLGLAGTTLVAAVVTLCRASGILDVMAGAACLVLVLALGAKAYQADFSSWQVEQRRFGRPAEYLRDRVRKRDGQHPSGGAGQGGRQQGGIASSNTNAKKQ